MRSFVRTVIAALAGAIEGLAALAVGVIVLVAIAIALTTYASGGEVSYRTFIPRAQALSSNAEELSVDGPPEAQVAVREAFRSLKYPVDAAGFRVVITDQSQLPADTCALYIGPENIIYISADQIRQSDNASLSRVLAHEIGHMIDATYFDSASRSEFMRLRGFSPRTVWTDTSVEWSSRASEDFAEVYAYLDAPLCHAPITTNGGQLANASSVQALIDSRRPDPHSRTVPLKVATQLNIAWNGTDSIRTNPILVLLSCLIVFLATGAGAANSMSLSHERVRVIRHL